MLKTSRAGVVALLGLLCARSAHADGEIGGVAGLVVGAAGGLAVAIVAAVFIAARAAPGRSKAGSIAMLLLGLPLLGAAIFYAVADAPRRAGSASEEHYRAHPLRQVVCMRDVPQLGRMFAREPDAAVLARALLDCAFDVDDPAQRATFSAGMPLLAAAPRGQPGASPPPHPTGYCTLMWWVHGSRNADALKRELQALGLPSTCPNERGEPTPSSAPQ